MFEEQPTARFDLTAGALYAIAGEAGRIYYGQISPTKNVGLFRRRDKVSAEPNTALAAPLMATVTVAYPSITRALRNGRWKKLGRFPVVADLMAPRPSVHWPVGTLTVTVSGGSGPDYHTRVEDPAIQDMELMAVWDAEAHIPARLTADFGAEAAEWHVGGPIWRERRIREEMASRFDQSWQKLPADWVPTKR